MAKLQCEICGGKLIGKAGGVFVCDSCGMEYDTSWAKEKIQEITGTVKIEGAANAQSLVKRGNLALEDEKWDVSEKCFNDVLNADPENAEAYLGIAMARNKCRNKEEFAERCINDTRELISQEEYQRAIQFSSGELENWLKLVNKKRNFAQESLKERLASVKKHIISLDRHMVVHGQDYAFIKEDGTLGISNQKWEWDVSGWKDIISISAGVHLVGLNINGTVMATGQNKYGQCDIASWKDIISVSTGTYHTVGLKTDGTVVAVGDNQDGQCNTFEWTGIKEIVALASTTFGLKADGTILVAGFERNLYGACDLSNWKNIIAIAAGGDHTVGLKSDGTVIAVGNNKDGRCDVSSWSDIVAITVGSNHTIGLKADGIVVAVGDNSFGQCNVSGLRNIVGVAASGYNTVVLKADGTVVAIGDNRFGDCNISGLKLFRTEAEKKMDYAKACALQNSSEEIKLLDAASIFNALNNYKDSSERALECNRLFEAMQAERVQQELAEHNEREQQKRIEALINEKSSLQKELLSLKGLFTGKQRRKIESRILEIDCILKIRQNKL